MTGVKYVQANAAAGELFALPPEELIGRNVSEFLADVEFEGAWPAFHKATRQRGGIALRRSDGELRYVEYSATSNVLPGRHLSILRDVTRRLQIEREREEALAQLKERVKELTLLHYAGHLLSVRQQMVPDLLQDLVELIPPGWQYPQITAACITFDDIQLRTENFRSTPWQQKVWGLWVASKWSTWRSAPRPTKGPSWPRSAMR